MSDTILTVGYGGYVKLDGVLCQVTSASVNKTYNIPTLTPFYQPFMDNETSAKSLIRAAYGTCSFSGQVTVQLTEGILGKIFEGSCETIYDGFFAKNKKFEVIIHDGINEVTIPNCMWQSINLQCQPSSLVTVSISFQSDNKGNENLNVKKTSMSEEYKFSDNLIPYWQTGADDMLQFNMTIDRALTPVYLNNDKIAPTYIRPGLINISLNATYYDTKSISGSFSIKIGKKTINFKDLALNQSDFRMSNFQDIGEKTYQWKSMPLDYTQPIFQIK